MIQDQNKELFVAILGNGGKTSDQGTTNVAGKGRPTDLDVVVLFGAASLFFATLEYLIPKPVPFFRIGLSNLPILLALPILRGRYVLLLSLVKVLGQALVGGTLASYVFIFSAGGSIASILVMAGLWYLFKAKSGWYGLALAGAVASNLVQIILSMAWVFGPSARVIAPLFMGLGLMAGLVVGYLAASLAERSLWYRGMVQSGGVGGVACVLPASGLRPTPVKQAGVVALDEASPSRTPRPRSKPFHLQLPRGLDVFHGRLSDSHHFLMALLVLPAFLLQVNLILRTALVLLWVYLAMAAGKKLQPLYFLSMLTTITVFSLLNPAGQVLVRVFGFPLTLGALERGLHRGLGIVGMVFVSLAAVRPGLRLPGSLGRLVARLLYGYEYLLAAKRRGEGRGLIALVDQAMTGLEAHLALWEEHGASVATKSTPWGMTLALILVIVHWVLLIV